MRLKIAQLTKGLTARVEFAPVRFVTGVGTDVLLQMRELREFPLADFTSVRLDPKVDARVLGEVAAVGECLGTLRAFVWLCFPHVDLRV